MKEPFKAFTIAVTGDFGPDRSFEKMRQWVQVNGGAFSYDINPKVTHLICSKAHFKKHKGLVRAARGSKAKIVSFDWLEDSLIKMSPRNERDYLLSSNAKAHKETQKKKKAVREENIKKGMESFERACRDFEEEMNSSNYGIYHDHTNYKYDITLARADLLTNKNERYMLKLYESHATPKLYACFEKYSKPAVNPSANILAPIGSSFEVAFDHFRKFFKLKTGKDWEERLRKTATSKDAFVFVAPKEGEPRGVMLDDGLLAKGEHEDGVVEIVGGELSRELLVKAESRNTINDLTDEFTGPDLIETFEGKGRGLD